MAKKTKGPNWLGVVLSVVSTDDYDSGKQLTYDHSEEPENVDDRIEELIEAAKEGAKWSEKKVREFMGDKPDDPDESEED